MAHNIISIAKQVMIVKGFGEFFQSSGESALSGGRPVHPFAPSLSAEGSTPICLR